MAESGVPLLLTQMRALANKAAAKALERRAIRNRKYTLKETFGTSW